MSLSSGTRLGVYEVVNPLGAGGMGEVYLARDTKLGRRVALKVLPELFVRDADRVARFEREAKMLAALNHPHIAALHGMDQAEGRHFLVMELIEGETLADRLQRGPMSVSETLAVARQIAEALEAAHEKGVIHRDLKPANVKITPDDQVKVLDFGLAKAIDSESASSNIANSPTLSMMASQAGLILGTAAYMSPEQAKGLPADQRSDIFSFGTVLFEMLTGRQPFQGETAPDILASVLVREPDLKSLPPGLHPRLIDLLRRCLEKHPRKRWQAIGDVRAEIETIQATSAIEEPPATTAPSRSLMARVLPLVGATALGAALTAVGFFWWRPAGPPAQVIKLDLAIPSGQQLTGRGRQILAISADGTQIAFTANSLLYRRLLSDTESRPVTGVDSALGANNPVFSPNGRSIVFWAADRSLRRITTTGGAPVTLCEAENPLGMTWGPSGIVYGQTDGIWRVSPEGGKPERLVQAGDGEYMHLPRILPGGTHILFTVSSGLSAEQWDRATIAVQPLAGGSRIRLVDGGADGRYVSSGHLIYALGGTLFGAPLDLQRMQLTAPAVPVLEGVNRSVAASTGTAHVDVSDNGSVVYLPGPPGMAAGLDLAIVERAGTPHPLKLSPSNYEFPRVSPDGTRVAFATDSGREAVVWTYPLKGTSTMSRLTFSGANRYPIWSADSQRVTYQSNREGDQGLFWQRADGQGAVERLTRAEAGTTHFPDAWSPDGKHLLFTIKTGPRYALWILSIDDRKATPFAGIESTALPTADISPDGRWVAYSLSHAGSSTNIFVQPFPPTGAQYQLLAGPGENPHHPLWSADGSELFYIPRVLGFAAVPVLQKPTFAFGTPVPVPRVFPIAPPTTPRTFDIAPDGRILSAIDTGLNSSSGGQDHTLRVMLNWFEELKSRLATGQQ